MKSPRVSMFVILVLCTLVLVSGWSRPLLAEYPYCSRFIVINYLPEEYVGSSLAQALRNALKRNIAFRDEIKIVNERNLSRLPHTLQQIREGKGVHVVIASVEMLSVGAPDMFVLDHPSLPLAFFKRGTKAFVGPLGQTLNRHLSVKYGAYFLGASWFQTYMVANKRKLVRLVDLKGLKVRTASQTMRFVLRAFGVQTVMLPFTEVYTALEKGAIDGTMFPALLAKGRLANYKLVALSGRQGFLPQGVAMIVSQTLLDNGPKEVVKPLLLSGYMASMETLRSWTASGSKVFSEHSQTASVGPADGVQKLFDDKVKPELFEVYKRRKISSQTIDALRSLLQ